MEDAAARPSQGDKGRGPPWGHSNLLFSQAIQLGKEQI